MPYQNILLIDDDLDDQEIFLTALERVSDSIICTPFDNASLALQKLTARQMHADLIFLDINMPIMNGQQFLKEIKKVDKLKHIPVIIFSTSSHPGTIEETRALGAHDFVTKPDRFDDLIAILKSIFS